jgi:hypothetical protein
VKVAEGLSVEVEPVLTQALTRCFDAFDFLSHLDDGTDGYLQSLRRVNNMAGYIVQEGEVWLLSEAGVSTLRGDVYVNNCADALARTRDYLLEPPNNITQRPHGLIIKLNDLANYA